MLVRFSCGCPWITVVKPQICGCGCGFQVDIQYRKLAVVVLTMIPKTTVLPQPIHDIPAAASRDISTHPALSPFFTT